MIEIKRISPKFIENYSIVNLQFVSDKGICNLTDFEISDICISYRKNTKQITEDIFYCFAKNEFRITVSDAMSVIKRPINCRIKLNIKWKRKDWDRFETTTLLIPFVPSEAAIQLYEKKHKKGGKRK